MTLPPAVAISVTSPAEEAQLDWYREDPLANDHHHHWHVVYPPNGPPTPPGTPRRTQPRQGELFFYMHQQMLARYDTERIIAGLDRCEPFSDYGGEIAEGYELEGYGPRPPGSRATEADMVAELGASHAEAQAALTDREVDLQGGGTAPIDENVLGCIVESSLWYPDSTATSPARLPYSNFHGTGHMAIASASAEVGFGGPMSYVETAIRDPIFYRWHRHVDDLYFAYQEEQEPADLADFAANVSFPGESEGGAPDVALCLARDIPGSEEPGFNFNAWGMEALGGDPGGGGPFTDELLTQFVTSDLALAVPGSPLIPDAWLQGVRHLTHEPFVYFIRVKNERAHAQDVTVRIFLAHAELAEDRRFWIELDKFHHTLGAGVNLIARPDARSSVVKRKNLTAPGAEAPAGPSTDVWCDCGWPYSLLLPSGASTVEGTPFKLLVAFTAWEEDHVGEPDSCGSMSFCGARNEYPDERRMGYPFERRIEGSIANAVAATPSMTVRDLRIRCTTERPVGA
jgi:tyrosinase